MMARVEVFIPDSEIDKATKIQIRKLQNRVATLEGQVQKLKKQIAENEHLVTAAENIKRTMCSEFGLEEPFDEY